MPNPQKPQLKRDAMPGARRIAALLCATLVSASLAPGCASSTYRTRHPELLVMQMQMGTPVYVVERRTYNGSPLSGGLTQAVAGAEEISIVEILDHHRIGVASTQQPILFVNRPVGSTSTIVADFFRQSRIPVPKPIAGLLMCGLISDTLNLTSPTTTQVDRDVMEELSKACDIRPSDLASEIFSVGSPLLTLATKDIITADCKEYEEHGVRFSVSQIEEISFASFQKQREVLLEELEKYRVSHSYLFSTLLITDVNTQNSILLVRGSESFTRLVDFPEDGPHTWILDGIVSRKKQLLPYLTALLARMA